jgi:peroxiredoxin
MNSGRSELAYPRRRLPDIRLPLIDRETPVPVRARGRKAPVLLLLHSTGCRDCEAYVQRLAARQADILEWDGRVLMVVPDRPEPEGILGAIGDVPFALAIDTEQRLAHALSVQIPALVIADQWGEIHHVEEAGPDHRFSATEEVVDWVRYLAIQCPECQGEAF